MQLSLGAGGYFWWRTRRICLTTFRISCADKLSVDSLVNHCRAITEGSDPTSSSFLRLHVTLVTVILFQLNAWFTLASFSDFGASNYAVFWWFCHTALVILVWWFESIFWVISDLGSHRPARGDNFHRVWSHYDLNERTKFICHWTELTMNDRLPEAEAHQSWPPRKT